MPGVIVPQDTQQKMFAPPKSRVPPQLGRSVTGRTGGLHRARSTTPFLRTGNRGSDGAAHGAEFTKSTSPSVQICHGQSTRPLGFRKLPWQHAYLQSGEELASHKNSKQDRPRLANCSRMQCKQLVSTHRCRIRDANGAKLNNPPVKRQPADPHSPVAIGAHDSLPTAGASAHRLLA